VASLIGTKHADSMSLSLDERTCSVCGVGSTVCGTSTSSWPVALVRVNQTSNQKELYQLHSATESWAVNLTTGGVRTDRNGKLDQPRTTAFEGTTRGASKRGYEKVVGEECTPLLGTASPNTHVVVASSFEVSRTVTVGWTSAVPRATDHFTTCDDPAFHAPVTLTSDSGALVAFFATGLAAAACVSATC
jgi:hypothetical protein